MLGKHSATKLLPQLFLEGGKDMRTLLCSPGWLWIHDSASAFYMLGLQACSTTSGFPAPFLHTLGPPPICSPVPLPAESECTYLCCLS